MSPEFQPQELVTVKRMACKYTCHRSCNDFLTRSFSSVLVDCLQSGCQTVEPVKTQHTAEGKGNGTKPQSSQNFQEWFISLSPRHGQALCPNEP